MSEVAEVLRAARALIDTPDKWCQGQFHKDGAYCASGAIGVAAGVDIEVGCWFCHPAWQALADTVNAAQSGGIGSWNDRPERTHADVLAAFDRAIATAEAQS